MLMYLSEEGWKDGGDPTWEHHRGRLYGKTWTKGLSVWLRLQCLWKKVHQKAFGERRRDVQISCFLREGTPTFNDREVRFLV